MSQTATPRQVRARPTPTRRTRIAQTSAAFLRMDIMEEISYPLTFALSQLKVIMPIFTFFFIGELVGDSPRVGGDYLTFVVIGLAVSAIMQGTMSGFGGSLQRAVQRGNLETLLVEPVPWTFLPFAMNLWQTILALFSGFVLLVSGFFLGAHYVGSGWPMFLLVVVLGVMASIAIGVLSASLLLLTLKSQPILFFYGLAASLLAGSVFSVAQLPAWLKWLAYVIPHTYVIAGARQALMADPGSFVMSNGVVIGGLVAFNVVILGLGLFFFRRSLEFARKMGILSGY